jgi:hypothetical protein
MAEVLIAFRRPPSMSAPELREWVSALRLACARSLAVSGPEGSPTDELRLCVQIEDGAEHAAEDELGDLLTDMRLLGLRPAVVVSAG